MKNIKDTKKEIKQLTATIDRRNQIEEILGKDKEGHQIIFELSPIAIGILDKKGNILSLNGRVYDWLGYKPEEAIGKNILEVPFLTKESKTKVKKRFLQRMLGKEIPPYELDFVSKDGKKIVGRVWATPIRDKNKKIIGDIVMISDVTDLKKAEESLRIRNDAIESSINAIGFTDPEGIATYINPAYLRMWGYDDKREVLGKPVASFWQSKEKILKVVEILCKKGGWVGELVAKRKDGTLFDVQLSATMVKNEKGRIICTMASFVDISERKKVERAKSEIISITSHQLRTPLTTTNWYSEMLLSGYVGKLDNKQKKYLEEIYIANQRLVKLVNALLNVSRIELGTLGINPEPTNLKEVADSVLDELLLQIEYKKIKMEKDCDKNLPIISADPKVIRIVFQNLLSNALKYTPEGGKVTLSIKKQKAHALIKVSDTGYGISRPQQSEVFTKFFRADNIKEKEPEGTGLGLYIVKSVLEQTGGKIWFESEENKGTAFFVKIPLKGMKKKKGEKTLT